MINILAFNADVTLQRALLGLQVLQRGRSYPQWFFVSESSLPLLSLKSFVDHIYTHCVCCIDLPRHQLGDFNACYSEVHHLRGQRACVWTADCRSPPIPLTLWVTLSTDVEDVCSSSLCVQCVIRLFLKCSKNTSVYVKNGLFVWLVFAKYISNTDFYFFFFNSTSSPFLLCLIRH